MGIVKNYKFTILCALVILVALLLPSAAFQKMPSFFGVDKVAHTILFFFFALSYMLEYRKAHGRPPKLLYAAVLVLGLMVGSELLQLLTSSRHFEFADMAFDLGGACIAFGISRIPRIRDRQKRD